jgi:hypothetical protein
MPETPALDRKIKRSAHSREARRLADETENRYVQFEQVGAMALGLKTIPAEPHGRV